MADQSGPSAPGIEPEALVGLLAEDTRLKVAAALVLGATTGEEIRTHTGLDAREVAGALERLAAGGLVVAREGGGVRLAHERIKEAARSAAQARAASTPPEPFEGQVTVEDAAVLRSFVRDGRLVSIPAAHRKRLVVLDWLAARFEPGRTYPERDVNFELGKVHADVAALRRYLVDEGFLERREGVYWRTGGTFQV